MQKDIRMPFIKKKKTKLILQIPIFRENRNDFINVIGNRKIINNEIREKLCNLLKTFTIDELTSRYASLDSSLNQFKYYLISNKMRVFILELEVTISKGNNRPEDVVLKRYTDEVNVYKREPLNFIDYEE